MENKFEGNKLMQFGTQLFAFGAGVWLLGCGFTILFPLCGLVVVVMLAMLGVL